LRVAELARRLRKESTTRGDVKHGSGGRVPS
jgi:hypothetical protein